MLAQARRWEGAVREPQGRSGMESTNCTHFKAAMVTDSNGRRHWDSHRNRSALKSWRKTRVEERNGDDVYGEGVVVGGIHGCQPARGASLP